MTISRYNKGVTRRGLQVLLIISILTATAGSCQDVELCGSLDLSPACQPATFLSQFFMGSTLAGTHLYVRSPNGVDGYSLDHATGKATKLTGSPFGTATNTYKAIIPPSQKHLLYTQTNLHSLDLSNPDAPASTSLSLAGIGLAEYQMSTNENFFYSIQGATIVGLNYNKNSNTMSTITGSPFGSGCMSSLQFYGDYAIVGQNSPIVTNEVKTFSNDSTTGVLSPLTAVGDLKLQRSRKHPTLEVAYFLSGDTNQSNVYAYSLNTTDGSYTQLTGSPFALESGSNLSPSQSAIHPQGTYLYVYSSTGA